MKKQLLFIFMVFLIGCSDDYISDSVSSKIEANVTIFLKEKMVDEFGIPVSCDSVKINKITVQHTNLTDMEMYKYVTNPKWEPQSDIFIKRKSYLGLNYTKKQYYVDVVFWVFGKNQSETMVLNSNYAVLGFETHPGLFPN